MKKNILDPISPTKNWEIKFYNKKVERETELLPSGIRASFWGIIELIEEAGPNLGPPHTKPLGKGLFEIRANGKEGIARSIFCTVKGKVVVILLSVVKKNNTLPKRYMETAKKRMKEIQHND